MKPDALVIAHLTSGMTYARYVARAVNRRGHVVSVGGALVTVRAVSSVPDAVQPKAVQL